jgi:hypothetical protein
MTTLTTLRDLVHAQTQTSTGDLSDTVVDWYLQQAYERTINVESRWPFFEQSWQMMLPVGEYRMALPGDVNLQVPMALYDVAADRRLNYKGPEWMDDHYYGPQVGTMHPIQYTIWQGEVWLYPRVSLTVEREYRLRGYRRYLNWLTPLNEPDCDSRLHLPLVHYAVALAYAQQEDETLETVYMDRWQRDVELARALIIEPRHHRPLAYANSINEVPASGPSWVLVPPG